ncbi:2-amino-4-hydroxy-6-hydroxymethyldihydropteridine pyrophosphokinase [Maioricimonas rarisocia]|uniref:2-amino-4-hydroxy-6-hydroxymethyldihydropteridine pyrophosphokinase n=1 Tax=Maioricimonas rarisocia TaxID=2528026 RepID=A0A517Z580_9PLAN|nr:2-amino-4-hydroxy-6-hydroxymethyldihydropteridine diphosphokinase [Maioricimonas rarisocia]QDU37625.1 2-amino-4-hydroxy-6-hydroxymethyldihydropteridine pyrophosphokinase [Maioricimonas rarisocia]
MTTDCLIALGGNRGDVAATIAEAASQLAIHPKIDQVQCSSLYVTAPVGANAADPFHNAAATLATSLSPHELLDVLQSIETAAGRERTIRWGPRPLDLDLILYGDRIVATESLCVPHPACWYRRFVLDPSVEIAAGMVHPVLHASIGELRQRLLERPLQVVLAGERPALISQLIEEMQSQFAEVALLQVDDAATEPALTICLDAGTHERLRSSRGWQRTIRIPQSLELPQQAVMDVLTSALDEPERQTGR